MAFSNASHFTMGDAQFNAIANQTNIQQSLAFDKDPLIMLLNHSAINATADSPSTSYEPTCHPGTREVITGEMMAWARDPLSVSILWLSGPAGAGKSCIQRKIVQLCTDEGLHAACFFFSIKESERSSETRFITTLTAQVAESIPGLKRYIKRAVKADHMMFTKSLDSQAEGLIFKPLQKLDDSMSNRLKRLLRRTLVALGYQEEDPCAPWTRANVIVIDGLDECVDQKEQAHILRLVHVLATHPRFPFRFVIASRPEYAIRTAFSSPPLSDDTHILRLEEYEANEDIRRFLKAEFSRLKSDHPASKSIPIDWPSTKDENALVAKASRQFVYVSVVMKHLANPRRNPMLELKHILGHRPSESDTKSNPFAELDALYNRILHPPDVDLSLLRSILHAIIHQPFSSLTLIDSVLDLAPGTTAFTLVDLHSVVDFGSSTSMPLHLGEAQRVSFYHKSMEDFLSSRSRARDLYQSEDMTHVQLTLGYYQRGRQHLHIPESHSSSWHLGQYGYLTMAHAFFVRDWTLFEAEFVMHDIPSFIDEWLIQMLIREGGGTRNEIWENYMGGSLLLSEYFCRYHYFHCVFRDGCLPQCQRLNTLNLIAEWSKDNYHIPEFETRRFSRSDHAARRKIIEDWFKKTIAGLAPPTRPGIPSTVCSGCRQ